MGILVKGKKKCECGSVAQWLYMPGFGYGSNPYVCNDCVITEGDTIGCSCNWRFGLHQEGLPDDLPEGVEDVNWRCIEYEGDEEGGEITKEDGYWIYLDENGKPYPCAEYAFEEDGYPDYTWLGEKIAQLDVWWFFFKDRKKNQFKRWWKRNVIDKDPYNS